MLISSGEGRAAGLLLVPPPEFDPEQNLPLPALLCQLQPGLKPSSVMQLLRMDLANEGPAMRHLVQSLDNVLGGQCMRLQELNVVAGAAGMEQRRREVALALAAGGVRTEPGDPATAPMWSTHQSRYPTSPTPLQTRVSAVHAALTCCYLHCANRPCRRAS